MVKKKKNVFIDVQKNHFKPQQRSPKQIPLYSLNKFPFPISQKNPISQNMSFPKYSVFIFTLFLILFSTATQSTKCRTSCGQIQINYPFGIDDGCGSPYYRHILDCTDAGKLELRTPSGRYPVETISYTERHIKITDPYMWSCNDGDNFRPTRPFSLDTSTHLSLSLQNEYMFFNCSEENVIVAPKPMFCERFPERCDSSCDSASYLCRHLPKCGGGLGGASCCSYYPKATESLRLMLRYCSSYTSVYWKSIGAPDQPYDQVPEYGIRVDFDIPVSTRCLHCQDMVKGGGTCGFDTQSQGFLCLCGNRNVTTFCGDHDTSPQKSKVAVISGTAAAVSATGLFAIAAGIIWFLRRVRAKAPVTCGVQSNDNRLF